MKKQIFTLFLAAAWVMTPVQAEQTHADFPTRTVSITVPYTPGGTTDFLARKLAEEMTKVLDQPVIVENRPGAGTTVAAAHIARQPADGHHLLVASNATLAINPYLDIPQNYSPEDFEPISLLVGVPNVIVSKSDAGKGSLSDWFAAAQQGDPITYGSMGVGTSNQIGMEVLLDSTDTDIQHIPYQGSAPALNDLLGGHVDLVVDTLVATAPHIKAGKMEGLAVLSAQRPNLVDIPTAKEALGVDVDLYSWFGLVAPKGTPQGIIDALNRVVTNALHDEELKKALEDAGVEIIGSEAEQFRDFIAEQHAMYGELIENMRLKLGNRMKNQVVRMNPAQLFSPDGFCHAVQVPADGKLLFISGQVSYDASGTVVGVGDIEAQTRRIFDNLQIILSSAGANFDDVVKYTFYVKDMSPESIKAIRKVRADYINEQALPSSTMIGVTALAKDELLLEVEAYAMQYVDSASA